MVSITSSRDEAAKQPHVVLIFMDDMTHWALTSERCRTPNLDRLAARGTVFTHAFNQGSQMQPVCLPARQMLLTGMSLFRASESFLAAQRLGRTLGDAGYRTFFTGKWHNEEEALAADYDQVGPWAGAMLHSGEIGGEAYERPAPGNTWDPADTTRGGHWMPTADGGVQHSSERWTDAALGFLDERAAADAHEQSPFFLHIAYHAPHDPRQTHRRFLDMYDEDEVFVPPNAWPEHPFDNGELEVRDETLTPRPRTPEMIRVHRREYLAILSHVDEQIGRILDRLEEMGVAEDTLVVFSGDHGLALGEHGLMGKQNPYDHSIRVPLLFAGPGVRSGRRLDELVYQSSIYATIAELVGVAAPPGVEMASLADAVAGRPHEERAVVFGAYRHVQRLVRTKRHKFVDYPQHGREQLFDLDADPWEMTNLAADPAYAGLRDDLRAVLQALQMQLEDPLAGAPVSASRAVAT
ncbi:sulfatase-like hydrolase/transferase [Microbacterium xanthum]|uniref:sulfatase-like hydrolase/transferase n=1 Tax=Microbacterium xanthum TaxID=3079794 RepID=UPI002AD354E3|nr:sulfatase-like hydrolase/transferase [Microbacterium sp. KSW-48]MDZ8170657.1 sulfatase-like hydrolase/transferase [Microbacterium sp. KSW-48]